MRSRDELIYIGSEKGNLRVSATREPIILFGAGNYGKEILNTLRNVKLDNKVAAFCDNDRNKQNQIIGGKRILSYDEVKTLYPKREIWICSTYSKIISEQLMNEGEENIKICILPMGIRQRHEDWERLGEKANQEIEKVFGYLEDEKSKRVLKGCLELLHKEDIFSLLVESSIPNPQYFDSEVWKLREGEIFLDVGSFNGDTIEQFIELTNRKYKKIIGFEANKKTFEYLTEKVKQYSNVEILNIGAWNKKDVLRFCDAGDGSSITECGTEEVNVEKIDDVLNGEMVSFIKMDIEGAEKRALLGARETIKKYKPRLAISIYHKVQDLYELPILIKEMVPEYKFRIRHYTHGWQDTVLYAEI